MPNRFLRRVLSLLVGVTALLVSGAVFAPVSAFAQPSENEIRDIERDKDYPQIRDNARAAYREASEMGTIPFHPDKRVRLVMADAEERARQSEMDGYDRQMAHQKRIRAMFRAEQEQESRERVAKSNDRSFYNRIMVKDAAYLARERNVNELFFKSKLFELMAEDFSQFFEYKEASKLRVTVLSKAHVQRLPYFNELIQMMLKKRNYFPVAAALARSPEMRSRKLAPDWIRFILKRADSDNREGDPVDQILTALSSDELLPQSARLGWHEAYFRNPNELSGKFFFAGHPDLLVEAFPDLVLRAFQIEDEVEYAETIHEILDGYQRHEELSKEQKRAIAAKMLPKIDEKSVGRKLIPRLVEFRLRVLQSHYLHQFISPEFIEDTAKLLAKYESFVDWDRFFDLRVEYPHEMTAETALLLYILAEDPSYGRYFFKKLNTFQIVYTDPNLGFLPELLERLNQGRSHTPKVRHEIDVMLSSDRNRVYEPDSIYDLKSTLRVLRRYGLKRSDCNEALLASRRWTS